ncbi:predicted protein [Plenodomus lingam JN3]|uniref:Predicted protein n=1 Tax=Leptosphaeria maculans (strain JN3 / isolate v23.1.3 / race Av1-4-5-6-7-8) TaxID=985895 RepID=E5ADC1_LEPMJ|nr:predicted protein [Plenodomus lingam JN3]CBY02473.1 predicted protein [Plenodomus lingam JN3]
MEAEKPSRGDVRPRLIAYTVDIAAISHEEFPLRS